MRQREYLCAIRIHEDTLMLNTLHYADEIREVDGGFSTSEVDLVDSEVEMAKTLVDVLSGDFEPKQYGNRYRESLLEIIAQKHDGKPAKKRKAKPSKAAANDLMAALRASVEAVRRSKGTSDAEETHVTPKKRRARKAS